MIYDFNFINCGKFGEINGLKLEESNLVTRFPLNIYYPNQTITYYILYRTPT